MRHTIVAVAACGLLGAAGLLGVAMAKSSLQLASASFGEGQTVPKQHTCEGANTSPPLKWSGAPAGTKSFVLTCFDPDAPRPQGWSHWGVFDLPAATSELAEGAKLPAGARDVVTDFKKAGWNGPCPPNGHGPHRYQFTVFALGVEKLEPAPKDYPALVKAAQQHALGSVTLTGLYERK